MDLLGRIRYSHCKRLDCKPLDSFFSTLIFCTNAKETWLSRIETALLFYVVHLHLHTYKWICWNDWNGPNVIIVLTISSIGNGDRDWTCCGPSYKYIDLLYPLFQSCDINWIWRELMEIFFGGMIIARWLCIAAVFTVFMYEFSLRRLKHNVYRAARKDSRPYSHPTSPQKHEVPFTREFSKLLIQGRINCFSNGQTSALACILLYSFCYLK